jgi:uncharacterized protein
MRCSLLPGLLAVSCFASVQSARAASFPCEKATTGIERAICSNVGLSQLDERLARAYTAAVYPFGGSYGFREAYAASLLQTQRTWLMARDSCGADVPCLERQYQRRLSVLSFGPDPDAPGPIDRFVGRFTNGEQAHAALLRLGPDRAIVLLGDAAPAAQGQWTCDFVGIGEVQGEGSRLIATTAGGEAGYTLQFSPRGLELTDNSGGNWCGLGGEIASPLRRVH